MEQEQWDNPTPRRPKARSPFWFALLMVVVMGLTVVAVLGR